MPTTFHPLLGVMYEVPNSIRVYRIGDNGGRVYYMRADGKSTTYRDAATFATPTEARAEAERLGWTYRQSGPTRTAQKADQ